MKTETRTIEQNTRMVPTDSDVVCLGRLFYCSMPQVIFGRANLTPNQFMYDP